MNSGKPNPGNYLKGRGTSANPVNRFERIAFEADRLEPESSRTLYLRDASKSAISRNDSPDVGFDFSINPYRGCEHGCIYCYARPTHEYLGFSAGLDFETRILVKEELPELLRKELSSKKWSPSPVALSGVTDPYQPVEQRLEITRRCLEVLLEFRNPVVIVTKSHRITRDIDILRELAAFQAVLVNISVTSLRNEIQSAMEPRTSTPQRRLEAIQELAAAGIPVRVLIGPVIPGLTEHEIPAILEAAASAGARSAGFIMLRLPYGVKELFQDWLEVHFPDRKERVLNRIRDIRQGSLNDTQFHSRMRGAGLYAEQIQRLFEVASSRFGLDAELPPLSVASFRRPVNDPQLSLFDQDDPDHPGQESQN
ncbi:MAG TPA: PA0069 family radical SAM protein [Acidobacteriota bacterium]|nr:PA0069 family radical SAM protein [Acidobacteriota bacterium]